MCGIAGVLVNKPQSFPMSVLGRLDRVLAHRGPDDRGFLLWNGRTNPWLGRTLPDRAEAVVGLVHRRLAILDLSESGWQPMASADGSCAIILNGEIYNYLELRRELEALGHSFVSRSDTEVLIAALCQWGTSILPRLVGMFAFAFCDWRRRRLILARDFAGIKPLYYATWPGGLAFASEIKALLEFPQVSRRVAPGLLHDYLSSGVVDNGQDTLFADVHQLLPAHFLDLPLDVPSAGLPITPQRFWRLPEKDEPSIGEADAAGRLREIFLDSVKLHLRSDVPIGAALSGGIDSSAIVMAMRSIGGRQAEIHTFTYAADETAINEERWAREIGAAADAQMHMVEARPEAFVADLDRLVLAQDQPFGSTSIYAQSRVFARAKEMGITVMMDGQGSDEIFAGYRPFVAARLVSLLRSGAFGDAWRILQQLAALPGESLPRNLLRIVAGLAPPRLLEATLRLRARSRHVSPWLDDKWFAARVVAPAEWRKGQGRRGLREALALSFSETSLPALLRYEDRNSMMHSIESRVPFLTPALVDFAFRLPEHLLVAPDGTSKSLLRTALRGLVPDAILDRRDKIGFQTPERNWLETLRPWVATTLSSPIAQDIPVFRSAALGDEFAAVMDGRLPFDWRIWRWLNLIRWTELMEVRFD
jgi:asparagine synthase (glutamine-hydrolysing)